jgi:hypothetical protein
MCGEGDRVERVHAGRVDPDEPNALCHQVIDQGGAERREILEEGVKIRECASLDQDSWGLDDRAKVFAPDARPRSRIHGDHLADSQIEIERPSLDGWSAEAVVAGRVGVRSEVDCGVQCRERDVVSPLHVEQNFAPSGGITRPDLQRFVDRWRDVVEHPLMIDPRGRGASTDHSGMLGRARAMQIGDAALAALPTVY